MLDVSNIPGVLLGTTLAPDWMIDLFFRGPAANDLGKAADAMFMFIFWVSVAFFVPMMVMMVYFVVKYRRRPGVAAPRSPSHNTTLELSWSVIPSLLLVPMFVFGFQFYMRQVLAPGGAEEARLNAQKWVWRITYDNGGESPETYSGLVAQPVPIFYIPAGRPMALRMTSADVIHSFWVPAMRKKFDVFPNRYNTYWLETRPLDELEITGMLEDGTEYKDYDVFCAEYCGDSHSEMAAVLRVVPDDYYRQWKKGIATPEDPVEWGHLLYKTRCATCHTLDGTRNIGPSWKGLWGRTEALEGGQEVTVDANYVRQSIYEPSAQIVKGYPNQMNSFQGQLNEDEINAIMAFMKTLADGGGQ